MRLWITSCLVAGLLVQCAACLVDTRKFYVRSPQQQPILLAPDLPTLKALLSPNAVPPVTAISVPNKTKGRMLDRKFLRGGELVEPYPANSYDMERDGAVEVVLFEITEGPQRGVRGWVQMSFLYPDFRYL